MAKELDLSGFPAHGRRTVVILVPFVAICIIAGCVSLTGPEQQWRLPSWAYTRPATVLVDSNDLSNPWDAIVPSERLAWVPCYRDVRPDLLCTRLTVPMDYNRPRGGPKVQIALIMLPGAGHTLEDLDSDFSISPLVINPGGPGGSGVEAVLTMGDKLSAVLGHERDLVSFDPRGTGATRPLADCFLEDYAADNDQLKPHERNAALMHRLTYEIQMAEIGLANSSDKALRQLVTKARGLTALCAAKDGRDSIVRHIGTPNVARDLLSIIQAWDCWRDERSASRHQENRALDHGHLDTRGKLVYWGFSYGTVLGATFASMFPDRVGRLVLDGVINLDIYRQDTIYDFIRDSDDVLESFFRYCYDARQKCYFYVPGQKPADLKRRYTELIARLEAQPLVVIPRKVKIPVAVRAEDVRVAIFQALSYPIFTFPVISLLLFTLERKLDVRDLLVLPDLNPICSAEYKPRSYPDEASRLIFCSDRRRRGEESLPSLQDAFEKMAETSVFADYWMIVAIGCVGWDVESVDPPEFDINSTVPLHDGPPINTSFPILFVSNTYDPVTPMLNGLAMARRFVNAGFLEQQAEGHCSISTVSLCTLRKIKAYLNDGVVPPPPKIEKLDKNGKGMVTGSWDRCQSDEHPWSLSGGGAKAPTSFVGGSISEWRELGNSLRSIVSSLGHMSRSNPLRILSEMESDTAAKAFRRLMATT